MVTSPPFHDFHPKGAAKETHPTLAVTAPLGDNGDDDRWFYLGRDGHLQDEGRRSARSPGKRIDGSHAGNVASAGPPDSVVPPVIPAPGGSIAASIDVHPRGGSHGGKSPVRVVDGDRALYPTGGSAAFRGGEGGGRGGGHSTVAAVEGDCVTYPPCCSVAIDRRCVGRRSCWESTVAPV